MRGNVYIVSGLPSNGRGWVDWKIRLWRNLMRFGEVERVRGVCEVYWNGIGRRFAMIYSEFDEKRGFWWKKKKGEKGGKGKGRGREKEWRLFEVPERCN